MLGSLAGRVAQGALAGRAVARPSSLQTMGKRADGRLEGVAQKAEAEWKVEAAQLQGVQERAPVAWTAVGRSLEHSARMAESTAGVSAMY